MAKVNQMFQLLCLLFWRQITAFLLPLMIREIKVKMFLKKKKLIISMDVIEETRHMNLLKQQDKFKLN